MLCTYSCLYHWIGCWVQTSPARIWSGSTCRRCCQARWRLAGLQWCTWWLFIISTGSSTSTLTPTSSSSSSWGTGLSGGLSSYRMRWEMITIHGTNMLVYNDLTLRHCPTVFVTQLSSLSIFSRHLKAHFCEILTRRTQCIRDFLMRIVLHKFTLYLRTFTHCYHTGTAIKRPVLHKFTLYLRTFTHCYHTGTAIKRPVRAPKPG